METLTEGTEMLVALLMAYLLGGGGSVTGGILSSGTAKELGKQIEAAVEDAARAKAAATSMAELRAEITGFEKRFTESGKALADIFKDHEAGGDAMLAVLEELNTDWEALQRRTIDLGFEIKQSLTREEWAEVFDDESD